MCISPETIGLLVATTVFIGLIVLASFYWRNKKESTGSDFLMYVMYGALVFLWLAIYGAFDSDAVFGKRIAPYVYSNCVQVIEDL